MTDGELEPVHPRDNLHLKKEEIEDKIKALLKELDGRVQWHAADPAKAYLEEKVYEWERETLMLAP